MRRGVRPSLAIIDFGTSNTVAPVSTKASTTSMPSHVVGGDQSPLGVEKVFEVFDPGGDNHLAHRRRLHGIVLILTRKGSIRSVVSSIVHDLDRSRLGASTGAMLWPQGVSGAW